MTALFLVALLATDAAIPAEPVPVEPGPAVEAAPADAPSSLAYRGHLEWIMAAGAASSRASPVNPGNRVLSLPAAVAESELRPDLRFELGPQLAAVVRPRLLLQSQRAKTADGWAAERSEAKSEWIEGYVGWRVSDRMALSYGLQNFQWGPAELISPSNRIFHATGFLRDPLYVVRGRHLARVNLSAGREWSAVLLAEVADNGEAPFVAGEPFEPKAQLKVEYTAPSGDAYGALTAGASQRSRAWFGEYATLPLFAGLAVYADAVHTVGRRAWYPVETPLGPAFAQTGMETRALRTTALGGLRYSLVSGADLRVEYLFDEAGWDDDQLALAERAGTSSPLLIGPWIDPGFELLGRHLVYVSLSLPDLPPRQRTRLQARYLHSLTDGSGTGFVTSSYDATDAVVAFLSVSATHGPADGALSRLTRGTAVLGATVNW